MQKKERILSYLTTVVKKKKRVNFNFKIWIYKVKPSN